MAYITQADGTIIARQGDSGKVYIEGLDTDKNYTVYFGVYDEKRKTVGRDVPVQSGKQPELVLNIPAVVSNFWVVPKDDEYKDYYYGIKVCDPESKTEETLVLAGCEFDTENILRVYPKKVEGLKSEDVEDGEG